jgi:hypothetical protein
MICDADFETEIFVLGCNIYVVVMEQAVFPDISEKE